jgi:signal transduction histidine kinase
MAVNGTRAWLSQIRESRGTVRARTTAAAVLVVGIALVVAAVLLVVFLQHSLTNDVLRTALLRMEDAIAYLEDGSSGLLDDRVNRGDFIPAGENEIVLVLGPANEVVTSSVAPSDEDNNQPRRINLRKDFFSPSSITGLESGEVTRVQPTFEEDDLFLAVAEEERIDDLPYKFVVVRTLEGVRESTQIVIGLLVIGIPFLLAIIAAVTWRVIGRALAPVESIRSEVESISTEELHRRVPMPSSKDEIARLAATMNQMLERLDKGQAKQRRFVSDASHELRSPVASIRQHSEVVLAHPDHTSAQELARVVLAEDLRIQRLVDDLLLLARMDEHRSDSQGEILDLDDVVFEEVFRVRETTDKKIDASRVSAGRVRGDRKQLARLAGNVLDNAVRHARQSVAVSLVEEDGHVVFQVDDDGRGVPPKDTERIFERFVRLDEARDRDSGGSGLGLAIVAEVTGVHGGSVRVLESNLGGARFEIRLPKARD